MARVGDGVLRQLTDLDLRLLKVFMAVAHARGVSAAQSALQMGQPAISSHLATLETRLGFRLCRRGRSGFALTARGERLLIACRSLFCAVSDFTRLSRALSGLVSGDIQVGLVDNLATLPGMPFSRGLRCFLQRHPTAEVHCQIGTPAEIERGLLSSRLDLGVGYFGQPLDGLRYLPWCDELQAIYCSRDHPLYHRPQADARQLREARWVQRGYLLAPPLTPLLPQRAGATAWHMEGVTHLILSGEYLGYLPVHYAERWVASGEMRQLGGAALAYRAPLSLAIRRPPPDEALAALLEQLLSGGCHDTATGSAGGQG